MHYYEKATGLKADVKCKDITRLCFVSNDPQLYKNIYNEKFSVADAPVMKTETLPATENEKQKKKSCIRQLPLSLSATSFIHQSKIRITKMENRNNYMYLLAF